MDTADVVHVPECFNGETARFAEGTRSLLENLRAPGPLNDLSPPSKSLPEIVEKLPCERRTVVLRGYYVSSRGMRSRKVEKTRTDLIRR